MLSPLPPAVFPPRRGAGHGQGAACKEEHGCSQSSPGRRSRAPGCQLHISTANLPFSFLGLLLEHGHTHLQPGQSEGEEH